MNTTELAAQVGVAVKTIERWEAGQTKGIKYAHVQALKAALGVTDDADLVEQDDATGRNEALDEWEKTTTLPRPLPALAKRTAETLVQQWGAGAELTPEAVERWMVAWWKNQPGSDGVDEPRARQRRSSAPPARTRASR